MKKILLALAMIASLQVANAQDAKTIESAQKAVESAQKAADDAKKGAKMATWMKLGQTLMEAYAAPMGVGYVGATEQDLSLLMATTKAKSTKSVTLGGKKMTRKAYAYSNYYFADGKLQMIEVTKPIFGNELERALAAYKKANELDVKGAKTKDIKKAVQDIAAKYIDEAYNFYTFGKYSQASKKFEAAVEAAATAPNSVVDTNSVFNIAYTAWMAGESDRAKKFFEKCLSLNYDGEGGEVYAKLADIADKAGDKEASVKYLETGFTKYPQSQSLLVGLINYYVSTGADSEKLFALLDAAKKNEPKNASLYYVEGQAREKLGQREEAMKAYDQCAVVNPKYEYGFIGKGVLLYNQAIEVQEKAQTEMDDAKYTALAKQFEECLKSCIDPFEKAFNLSKDKAVKASIAEYLKNACFRFRTSDEEYQKKYEKYSAAAAEK